MTDGAGDRATVVVANTDPTVCEVLARVVEAGGREAVRVTEASLVPGAVLSAPADALVLDLGAANVEQLRSLRAGDHPRSTESRVVVISTGPANALLAWQAGTDAVLTRPFAAEALQTALTEVMARTNGEREATRAEQVRALST